MAIEPGSRVHAFRRITSELLVIQESGTADNLTTQAVIGKTRMMAAPKPIRILSVRRIIEAMMLRRP
jgi:hypothetical protein